MIKVRKDSTKWPKVSQTEDTKDRIVEAQMDSFIKQFRNTKGKVNQKDN